MANWYVYHAAAGSGTGADWTNAYVSLNAAMTAKAAGDVFFVAHDHAQTQGSALTITSPGTELLPCRVYCVDRAGSVPPVSADLRTTATISTTGAFSILVAGTIAEIYGITFSAGSGSSNASLTPASGAGRTVRLVNCLLKLNTTNASPRINLGNNGGGCILENTPVQFGSTSQAIAPVGRVVWKNTASAIAGSVPTTLFNVGTGTNVFLEGVDLSAAGSGKVLVGGSPTLTGDFIFKDCKLGASVTVYGGSFAYLTTQMALVRCDSGDTNYRTEFFTYAGTQTTETTIVRSGGATDGTTPIAWKIITTANSEWEMPFVSLPISIWNETTGSAITVTIQGIWGGGAVPVNTDIYIDVEYLGTSGFPIASRVTTTKADPLASSSNIAAGSGTWGGSTTKFAMAATFTPQEKGPITIYVKAALASTTFYIDPKPVIT